MTEGLATESEGLATDPSRFGGSVLVDLFRNSNFDFLAACAARRAVACDCDTSPLHHAALRDGRAVGCSSLVRWLVVLLLADRHMDRANFPGDARRMRRCKVSCDLHPHPCPARGERDTHTHTSEAREQK